MHLKILEDYIAELLKSQIEDRSEFIDRSSVISRLMDIIIEEERRIPDFVVDGDTSTRRDAQRPLAEEMSQEDFWDLEVDDLDDLDDQLGDLNDHWWSEYFNDDSKIEHESNFYGVINDPGFLLPIGNFLFTIERTGSSQKPKARRLRWVIILTFAVLVGLAAGLVTAP